MCTHPKCQRLAATIVDKRAREAAMDAYKERHMLEQNEGVEREIVQPKM